MTTPKPPAQHGLPLKSDPAGLVDTIKELDGLITDKASVPQEKTGTTGIPVLDEIIEPDSGDYIEDMEMLLTREKLMETPPQQEHISHEQLEIIIGNVVKEKLANELDALVNILKDTIKDSIMTEIKAQLETGLLKTKTEKPEGDPS